MDYCRTIFFCSLFSCFWVFFEYLLSSVFNAFSPFVKKYTSRNFCWPFANNRCARKMYVLQHHPVSELLPHLAQTTTSFVIFNRQEFMTSVMASITVIRDNPAGSREWMGICVYLAMRIFCTFRQNGRRLCRGNQGLSGQVISSWLVQVILMFKLCDLSQFERTLYGKTIFVPFFPKRSYYHTFFRYLHVSNT